MPLLTGKVAQEVGVTRQTVRTWATRFSEFVSLGATAEGAMRYYTDEDLEVLRAVALWRREFNLGFDEIADQLRRGAHLELPAEGEALGPEPAAQTGLVPLGQLQPAIDALVGQWRAIADERQQEVAGLREENRRLREELAQRRTGWLWRLFGR